MELLTLHHQGVADLPPDDQEDNLFAFDIIQDAEVTSPQLEFGQRIGPQPFDGLGRRCRPVREPGEDRGPQNSLLAGGQGTHLRLGLPRDRDSEGHRGTLDPGCCDGRSASSFLSAESNVLLVFGP
jgi:hypothetical protein